MKSVKTGGQCAGIVGGIESNTAKEVTILNCYNVGDIQATSNSALASGILGSYTDSDGITIKVQNCYYLTGKATQGVYTLKDTEGICEMLESDYMKSLDFVFDLGTEFELDKEIINDGYPILK